MHNQVHDAETVTKEQYDYNICINLSCAGTPPFTGDGFFKCYFANVTFTANGGETLNVLYFTLVLSLVVVARCRKSRQKRTERKQHHHSSTVALSRVSHGRLFQKGADEDKETRQK